MPAGGAPSGHHELYLMCDDVEETVAELEGQGRRVHVADRESGLRAARPAARPGGGRDRPLPAEAPTAYDLEELTRCPVGPTLRYEGISAKAYEHPADRAATAALHSIPLMDQLIKRLCDFGHERRLAAGAPR